VGSVRANQDGNGTCYIGRLIVHPDYPKRGIGTQLMYEIETIYNHAQRFELFTGSRSQDNIRLYEKLGYQIFRKETLSPQVELVFFDKHPQ
jgi:ribosomal protein S18 acetylase RimI-like enzyme